MISKLIITNAHGIFLKQEVVIVIMIDTIDFKLDIDFSLRLRIIRGVNKFIKKRNISGHGKLLHPPDKNNTRELVTASFTDKGIQEFAVCCDQYPLDAGTANIIFKHYVRLTVKPANVLYPDDRYALSRADDLDRSEQIIDLFISEVNQYMGYPVLPPITDWRVTRIDYAYQVASPYSLTYLLLFKKERPVKKSKVYYCIGCNERPAEIRYWNGNINFHVYDKTVHLWEKYRYYDEINQNHHVLRFEIQCKGRSISSLVHRNHLGGADICSLWNPEIADMKVRNAIKGVIGCEDFYNLANARKVLGRHFSERKVQDMMEFMEPGVYPKTKGKKLAALYAERFGLEKSQVKNKFLPYFHKAGVNVRALPDKWGIDHLVNPVKLLGL